jgi:hypothetical protein
MAKKIATTTEQYTVNARFDNSKGSKVYATCMNNKRLPSVLLTSDEVGIDNLPENGEGFMLEHTGKQLVRTTKGQHLIVSNAKVIERRELSSGRSFAPVAFDEDAFMASLAETPEGMGDDEVPFT